MNENNIRTDIENLVIQMFRQRFINEREAHNNTDNKDSDLQVRCNMLDRIISTSIPLSYDVTYNSDNMDNHIFQQEWKYLKHYHKLIKVKEYISEHFTHQPLVDYLNCLFSNLPEGKICGAKHILYDPKTQKIILINCIKFNKDDDVILV